MPVKLCSVSLCRAVGFLGYRLDVVFQFCRLAQDVHSVDKQKADVGRASLVHVLTP